MKDLVAHLWHWLYPPAGRGVRDIIALFSIAQGVLRFLPQAHLNPVNILSSHTYGVLALVVGLTLLLTGKPCRRLTWLGQLAAVLAAGLWLLLALDVIAVSWASAVNSFIIAGAAANEVRANEC